MSSNLRYASSIKSSGLTRNQLAAFNLRNRTNITNQNSSVMTTYNLILNGDENTIKKLLFSMGKSVFDRYIQRILVAQGIKSDQKAIISTRYQTILNNLTLGEKYLLGLESPPVISNIESIPTYFTFYCSVNVMGGQSHIVIRNKRKDTSLVPGLRYAFDLSHPTNTGTLLSFSYYQYEFTDVPGLTFVGTPGLDGAKVIYDVPLDIGFYNIWLYNKQDPTPNAYYIFPYVTDRMVILLNYKARSTLDTTLVSQQSDIIVCLKKDMTIRSVEFTGPKYVIEDKELTFFKQEGFDISSRYKPNVKYGIFYGSYNIYVNNEYNAFTILNKGKEHLINLTGDPNKKKTITLKGLDINNPDLDGDYDFYYGDIIVEVFGDFGKITLFSEIYGINSMEDILVFDDQCYGESGANTNYENVFYNDIFMLHKQSSMKVIQDEEVPIIRFNETLLNYNRLYGVTHNSINGQEYTQYLIFDIPSDHPIAFINQEKVDENGNLLFKYFGVESTRKRRLGPDNNVYDFYYGTIIVYVYGDFGRISIYDFYHGYAGGKYLIQYVESDDGIVDTVTETDPEYNYNELLTDVYNIIKFESYMNFNIVNNKLIFSIPNIDNENYVTNVDDIVYDASGLYFMYNGTYVIMNIPKEYPIAFLNNGLEELFSYDGYYPYRTDATGPDGFTYKFYYGNVNIYVKGDFGRISMYILNKGFFNGRKLFVYNDDTEFSGYAITQNSIDNAYPNLTSEITDDKPQEFYIDIDIFTYALPYSYDYSEYRFFGRDRNGEIDSTIGNPQLLFYLGDVVYFNFLYNNINQTFAIYERARIIENPQVILNNGNTSRQQIRWTPTLTTANYYYYRSTFSGDLMYNVINVKDNGIIDIVPNLLIDNIYPPYGATNVTVELSKLEMEFDEIMNISNNDTLDLYKLPLNQLVQSFTTQSLINNGSKTITYKTNYNSTNRLEFSTTYYVKIPDTLIRNVYNNKFKPPYYIDDNGDPINPGEENILFKFTTQEIHDPKLLSIKYLDVSTNEYLTLENSAYIDVNGNIVNYDEFTYMDLFGEIVLEFSENIEYKYSTYGFPYFSQYGQTFIDGYTSFTIRDNVMTLTYNTDNALSLTYSSIYRLNIEQGSIVDMSNIEVNLSNSLLNSFYITTKPDPRPILASIYPYAGETAVPVTSSFTLTFDKIVYPGTSGSITVKEQFNQSIFHIIQFIKQEDIDTITGWGTNTITFSCPDNFNYFTYYTLLIDSTCIRNEKELTDVFFGEFYEGLNDEGTYYFRTATSTT